MTEFEQLLAIRLADRTIIMVDLDLNEGDVAGAAVVFKRGRCVVVATPTIGDDLLHVELDSFVDETAFELPVSVTVRP